MKKLNSFFIIFFLGWLSLPIYSQIVPVGEDPNKKSKKDTDQIEQALRSYLRESGLVIPVQNHNGILEYEIREKLSKYCPTKIQALSTNIPILFSQNSSSTIANTIKQDFKNCVGKIVEKHDKLVESFVKPVNVAYSNNTLVNSLTFITSNIKSNFDAGGGGGGKNS